MTGRGKPKPAEMPFTEIDCPQCGVGHLTIVDGRRMRTIRQQAGWATGKLAAKIGISAAYLSDMELGRRRMSEEWAAKILEACR